MSAPGLQAIHAVGGVVPPGLLARIQAGELTNPASTAPASYHLIGRETVRDAASRAWSYLRGAWDAWRDYTAKQPPGTHGTSAAREQWLLVLLRELGYGQVPALPGGYTIDDRSYPISHAWQHVPIHLLGPSADLNHRNPDIPGAARAPQAMVQEFLNRSPNHLWAILANGLRLRLLRDSTALAGSAYLEFDLEAIFDGELYPEFLLMWQLCHVSRLEQRPTADDQGTPSPAGCWLETWRGEAADAGTRMLDRLRDGVADAITALGTGFIRHPANRPLVEALQTGTLTTAQYHRALLRLVYRLLFCFVAEDRDALLHPDATSQARDRYTQYFSTARLRKLSRTRAGSPHHDLWQAQTLVLRALGGDGHPGLGLPPLAGLFDPDPRQPRIDPLGPDTLLGCALTNEDLLAAIRRLAWVAIPGQRVQPVDYRNLGAEELGSVYESLLELVPRVDLDDRTFQLVSIKGNDRKTTGSYYTPPSLVSALLDTALDPLLDETVTGATSAADAETRLLALTVCDPACGSGHFLVAAARRIARRLAQVRSGDDEPTPAQIQHALRDVIGRCIYGVDLNDLAAELAKVSLWLEALEPGKPLGFLDARIRVGNSLLGTTPALLKGGIPDEAFKPLDGDDKKTLAALRKRNKIEAKNWEGYIQDSLFGGGMSLSNSTLAAERAPVLKLADDVNIVRDQARRWENHARTPEYRGQRIHADMWCAAFVWPVPSAEARSIPEPPTNSVLRAVAEDPSSGIHAELVDYAEQVAEQYRFFHWYLEFPEIFRVDDAVTDASLNGWSGGFACVIGNPPWERVKLQEKEFFASRHPVIADAPTASARKELIAALEKSDSTADRALFREWLAVLRSSDGISKLIRESGAYPLTAVGDINTYAIFTEAAHSILDGHGRLGLIVPTGISTDATTQHFFRQLVEGRRLDSLLDFVTNPNLWTDVGNRRYRFCILCVVGSGRTVDRAEFATLVKNPADLPPRGARIAIPAEDLLLVNPNTGTSPMFESSHDAKITLGVYRRIPVLWLESSLCKNSWGLSFLRMLDMANDSGCFITAEQAECGGWNRTGTCYVRGDQRLVPLYEAKLTHQFDHRLACYSKRAPGSRDTELPRLTDEEKRDPTRLPVPRYWVPQSLVDERLEADPKRARPCWSADWLIGWRDIARSTDERTLIVSVLPRFGVGHTEPLFLPSPDTAIACFLANLSTFCVDYIVRQSLSGTHLTYTVLKQIPVIPPEGYLQETPWGGSAVELKHWITPRVLELCYTAFDVEGFARDHGDQGPPFIWDAVRREFMRAELDAAYFHLYGVDRDDVDYVMDTFKVVRERDEKTHGEYRTKRLILEVYDAMRQAIDSGKPYDPALAPPPGHGARHPARSEARS